ncbi:ABC transporter permease [Streptomyces sp. NPDC048111]|uniref:ABC transporter permease n=1 Tax=Streptomyces sp. NPDC048111 TaxID=3365500 RepID=UPI00371B3B3B
MSTLTRTPAPQNGSYTRRRRLRGPAWLMVRQHRAVLVVCLAATVIGALWISHERSVMLDTLHGAGWPAKSADRLDGLTVQRLDRSFSDVAQYVGYLPLLFGVFVGAPLIAADLEQGTARLAVTQSVPRLRWLLWKLGFTFVLVVLTTGTLGALLARWWRAGRGVLSSTWLDDTVFGSSWPVLTALTLFTTCLGIAIGLLVRRAVAAMALTLVGSGVTFYVFDYLRPRLGTPRRVAFPFDGARPAVLGHGVEVDQWVGTASGKVYGWGTCVNDAVPEACRARLGIVNDVRDYFGDDQMAGLQWTAAGLFTAATVLLLALIVWRAGRQAL